MLRSRTLRMRPVRRGHQYAVRPPVFINQAVVTPSNPPVVTKIMARCTRQVRQPRRAGHSLGAPSIVVVPIVMPAAVATATMPPAPAAVTVAMPEARARAFVRTNLLRNSGGETDTVGWNDFGGAEVSRNIVQSHAGVGSFEIVQTSVGQGAGVVYSDPIPVRPGELLSVAGWARGENADKAQLWIQQYNAADASLNITSVSVNLTPGNWTQVQQQATRMLATTDHIRVALVYALQSAGAVPANVALGQWDDLQLEYGPVNTTLIPTDGSPVSDWSLNFSSSLVMPAMRATASMLPFGFGQDLSVALPAAQVSASMPDATVTYQLTMPRALATVAMTPFGFSGFETIVVMPPMQATASFPTPCLRRTLGVTISTPGVLALEPLLPPDTCQ